MAEGQGNITYGTTKAAGGGGGFPAAGAANGLTIELIGGTPFVVLGNSAADVTEPAALLNNRRIQMTNNSLLWAITGVDDWGMLFNDISEGANNIPLLFESPQASYWQCWQPSNYGTTYTPGGTANRWRSGYDVYPGVNPGTTRPNVVGTWFAYNTSFQMGRVDPTEAAFRYATETYFEISGDPHLEFHTPEMTTDGGTIFRLDSNYVSRVTGNSFRELVVQDMSWFDLAHNPSTGQFYADISYTPSSDLTRYQLMSQFTDGVTEIVIGNWVDGTSTINFQGGLTTWNSPGGQLALNGFFLALLSPNNVAVFAPGMAVSDLAISAHDPTAVLDCTSNTKGLFVPRLTTTERLAINLAGALTGGLICYDITIGKYYGTTGSAPTVVWEQIQSV